MTNGNMKEKELSNDLNPFVLFQVSRFGLYVIPSNSHV